MNLFLNNKYLDELVKIQQEVALVKHFINSVLVVIVSFFVIQLPCLTNINTLIAGSKSLENCLFDKKSFNDIVEHHSIQKRCEESILNLIETTGADA